MNELTKISQTVKVVLENDEKARNDDQHLWLEVLKIFAAPRGLDIGKMPLEVFLSCCNSMGLPNSESVRRSRQKNQEKYPELRATDEVVRKRREREKTYRNFARGIEQ